MVDMPHARKMLEKRRDKLMFEINLYSEALEQTYSDMGRQQTARKELSTEYEAVCNELAQIEPAPVEQSGT